MSTTVSDGLARRKSSDRRSAASGADAAVRTRRVRTIRLLVVVDAAEKSARVLQYVGRFAAGCECPELHLAFIASHPPPELLETGGSEVPGREARLGAKLRKERRGWMAVADRKDWRILRAAETTLQRAGVAASRISAYVSSPLDARTAVDEVLLLAREQRCGTVVVGHRAHSWLRGLGGGDLAEKLVRRAKGFAVWVVG